MMQREALDVLKTGGNVFLTGEPGAGKTHVLNQYITWLEDCGISVATTASTGIAATHIGGMTIHAWSGIGARNELSAYDLDAILGKEHVVKRIKKAQVLVIDEVSMLDGRMLEMVETVTRKARGRDEPFGGLQVVLVGDFYQLPPIAPRGDVPQFAFSSGAWRRGDFLTCYLAEQYRHEDELLSSLLTSLRRGEVDEEHYILLGEQHDIAYEHIEPTKLFTHNRDVDSVNSAELAKLTTESRVFTMHKRGNRTVLEALTRSCLSPETLELRVESMVMCTKNNFDAGYVNGTLGRVIGFERESGHPTIETSDGREITITPATWSVEEGGKPIAEVTQIPLRLAWAITIHKSQGMSLDAAEIDLRNAFTYGQGYVALSRVRTLAGMKVLGLNANSLMVDPQIIAMDERFKNNSDETRRAFDSMEEKERRGMHEQFVKACGGTMPSPSETPGMARKKRIEKPESTYDKTKALLKKGHNAAAIAREREMAESTIWGHIEKLAADGQLSREELCALVPSDLDWDSVFSELRSVMEKEGTEKLKPIYEGAGEKYDYTVVRLGRLLYTLG